MSEANCWESDANCREALQRLETFLDGELDDRAIVEVSQHLADCYPCGDRADFERHLRQIVRTCAEEVAPAGLLERVKQRCFEEATESPA